MSSLSASADARMAFVRSFEHRNERLATIKDKEAERLRAGFEDRRALTLADQSLDTLAR